MSTLAMIDLALGNISRAKEVSGAGCQKNDHEACLLRAMVANAGGNSQDEKKYLERSLELSSGGAAYLAVYELEHGNKKRGRALAVDACLKGRSEKACRIQALFESLDAQPGIKDGWEKGCLKNIGEDCYWLGLAQSLTPGQFKEGRNHLQKACDLKYGIGCLELGNLLNRFVDHKKEGEFMKKACDLKTAGACSFLGSGVFPFDLEISSEKYLERACNLGDGPTCGGLGNRLFHLKKKSEALEKWKQACELKHQESCYWHVVNSNLDEAPKGEKIKKLCEQQVALACLFFGKKQIREGAILPALETFKKSCQKGSKSGCYEELRLRSFLDRSFNFEAEVAKLCRAGSAESCFGLGKLFEEAKAHSSAKEFFGLGCDLLDKESCSYLGFIAVEENQSAIARKYYRRSCDYGSAYGCRKLIDFE